MFFIKLIKKIICKRCNYKNNLEEKETESKKTTRISVFGYFKEGQKLSLSENDKKETLEKIVAEIAQEGLYEFLFFPEEKKYEISVSVNIPSNKGGGI